MILDGHVHFVGASQSGNGCWFSLRSPWDRIQARMMLKECGIHADPMTNDLDSLFLENLVRLIRESSLDGVVLLAQDIAYTEDGIAQPERSKFYVPNEVVLSASEKYNELIPAVSIHPARRDAMNELGKCIERGAKVLKLLPNVINVDCSSEKYKPFWEKMADAGMILLAHTGGEMTLPVLNANYANPRILDLPLSCGVTCIAAHCAGGSYPGDKDYTQDLLQMFTQYPHLYGDNSALCSINRNRALKYILNSSVQERIIHGSDYPVPVSGLGPFMRGVLSWKAYRKWKKCKNPLERDYQLKKSMGFHESTFTRLNSLLELT